MEIKDEETTAEVAMVVQSRFRRVCVFCGSSHGKKIYQDAAIELGKELVARNIDLVYGGGSVGLMGLVSQAVYNGGRHVIGVIPKTLMPREISGETVGEVKAVADMHQRKAEMARQSDAFIALPGVLSPARESRIKDEMGDGTHELPSELRYPHAKGGKDDHRSTTGKQAMDVNRSTRKQAGGNMNRRKRKVTNMRSVV